MRYVGAGLLAWWLIFYGRVGADRGEVKVVGPFSSRVACELIGEQVQTALRQAQIEAGDMRGSIIQPVRCVADGD